MAASARIYFGRVIAAGMAFAASPVVFVFFSQFLIGTLQVKAFFSYTGDEYLTFSSAYLGGSILAILLSLNAENEILGGDWNSAFNKYLNASWMLGVLAVGTTIVTNAEIPNLFAFAFLQVSIRIFVAWANSALPSPVVLILAGIAVSLAAWLLALPGLILVIFAALVVAKASGRGVNVIPVVREGHALYMSFRAFLAYLPHTLSGIVIGNFDRFLALSFVGGASAELYLRTLQIFAWATFILYPFLFFVRRQVILRNQLRNANEALQIFAIFLISIISIFFILIYLISLSNYPIELNYFVMLTLLLAMACSQSYQVISILIFIRKDFGVINRITLTSCFIGATISVVLVWLYASPVSLAAGLLAGWASQLAMATRAAESGRLRRGG